MLHTWVNPNEWREKECFSLGLIIINGDTPGLIMLNGEKGNASLLG